MEDILKTFKILFTSIVENITSTIAASDLVRLSIDNPKLDFPITLPFMKMSALTVDKILPIYINCHDNHYGVITKMTGFLNKSYYCHVCKNGYDKTESCL